MKKILTLSVTALKEKLFVAFMIVVLDIINMFDVLNEKLGYYVSQFKAAYNHLNDTYLKYDLKYKSEQVVAKDNERVKAFRMLRDKIRYALTYPVDEAMENAAKILMEIIKLYDCSEISRLGISEKTAALTNLIEDYEQKYMAQVEALGLGTLLSALRTAQDDFMGVYLVRTEAESELGLKAMADARRLMTEAYRDLVTAVNLEAKRDVDDELTDFINMMNVEIRKNFIYTGQSGTNTNTGSGDDSDSGLQKYTNFIFENGTEVKLWFAVGAPIVAPENTPGFIWKPEVPEFMPARSKTFREVPIDSEEVSAIFHFADHREEEIREVVGAILHAPENTTGYVWDPEVPEFMPAENTSYYEMLANSEEEEEQDMVTITFRYHDGREVVRRYPKGTILSQTSLEVPEHSPGYTWGNYHMPLNYDMTINEYNPNEL